MDIKEETINISTALLLLVFNTAMLIIKSDYNLQRYINMAIPVIGIAYFIIFKNNKYNYIIYTLTGVLINIFGTPDNYAGSILFFISMYDNKKPLNIWINIILIIASLCIKSFYTNYYFAHILSLLVAFYFILSHMYIRFWPIASVKEGKHAKGLSVEQIATVKYLILGTSHAVAAKELNIERTTFTARVKGLKKRYNVKKDFQLALCLIEDGVIGVDDITYVKLKQKAQNK